jgi:hypothetical protein
MTNHTKHTNHPDTVELILACVVVLLFALVTFLAWVM